MSKPRPTPAQTAFYDQAAAAARHRQSTLAAHLGAQDDTPLTGPAAAVVGTLGQRIIDRQVTFCAHVNMQAPQPTVWTSRRPGRLRCPACTSASMRSAEHDKPRCAHCRATGQPMSMYVVEEPGVVVETSDGRSAGSGPITLIFELCPGCAIASGPPAPPSATATYPSPTPTATIPTLNRWVGVACSVEGATARTVSGGLIVCKRVGQDPVLRWHATGTTL
jgi:hypothetical protein